MKNLKFKWFVRDQLRIERGMEPDGLYNCEQLPCGTSIVGVEEDKRQQSEQLHFEHCNMCIIKFIKNT